MVGAVMAPSSQRSPMRRQASSAPECWNVVVLAALPPQPV